ncbi:MAG TPA: GDP-mannose 4,6-dehydratase [Candidatus Limnocylindrales bacterium]|jgi:NAD dependent epimerase/dehydratase
MSGRDDTYWNGRRVSVSGAGGFIGSHLAERLVRAGAQVRAMVRYNGRSELGSLAHADADVRAAMEIIHSDVTDPYAVRRFVEGSDTVFHLAALIAIPYSYAAPASYVATNVSGTLHMLEAVRDLGIAHMVQTSTSETYGTARTTPIDEDHPLQPQSPYAASKVGADALAESFHRAFDVPVATIRPFNTFGPRQSARAVVPTIASQVLAGRSEIRLGDLRPRRDLTYVADTVEGFLAVARAPACVGMVTNIGSGTAVSIGELAALIAELAGKPGLPIVTDAVRVRPEGSEVFELVADAHRAAELTGWRPEVSLRDGLRQAIEFVRNHPDAYDPDRYAT